MVEQFSLSFSDGAARALHQKREDLESGFPWESLNKEEHPPERLARARRFWTENAFNEYSSAVAMSQLAQALGQARTPVDLWRMAAGFASDELVHTELCARVAMRVGGASPLAFNPDDLELQLEKSLSPRQRACELVMRVCCVGEALSLPLLSGNRRAATQPLARAVLDRIVHDEGAHARFGWLYLDWIAPALDADERARLSAIARRQLGTMEPLWRDLRNAPAVDSGGLGWMQPAEWASLARESVERSLRAPLARYGISI